MNVWRRTDSALPHEVGAGVVAGVATLVASVVYWVSLLAFLPTVTVPFTVELYTLSYTGFVFFALLAAPFVGFVVGTAVWRWTLSQSSSPSRGALAGAVTALGTVLAVPVLFGLLLAVREVSGASPAIFTSPLEALVVTSRGGVVYWGTLTGLLLVPLGAIGGWLYQRRATTGLR